MLWPVELDAAGDPWASQPHQRRFDYILAVEEVIVLVGLVLADEDPPADFRQHDEPHVFVLQPGGLIGDRVGFIENLVDEWHGIDFPG